eukprot:5321098-Prorocentrum_lima.AAC.1
MSSPFVNSSGAIWRRHLQGQDLLRDRYDFEDHYWGSISASATARMPVSMGGAPMEWHSHLLRL